MPSIMRLFDRPWRVLLWVSLLIWIGFVVASDGLGDEKITSFSADWVFSAPEANGLSGTAKLYLTPEAYRMDGMPWGGRQGIPRDMTILSLNRQNKQYIYNHEKKLVYESEINEQEMMGLFKSYENVESEEILGKEKVSGYICTKKRVVTTLSVMGMNTTRTETIWQSDKFDIPLRIRGEEGNISELQNIDTRKPSAKQFHPLTGYEKTDHMMAVYGMDISGIQTESEGLGKDAPRRRTGKPEAWRKTERDTRPGDSEKIMASQENDPEQMRQIREALSLMLAEVRPSEEVHRPDMDDIAARGLWQVVPKRHGDRAGRELKGLGIQTAILGTSSSFEEVCHFYEQRMNARGWENRGSHIQNGIGFLLMTGEGFQLLISSSDDPGMSGTFTNFYTLKLENNLSQTDTSRQKQVSHPVGSSEPRKHGARKHEEPSVDRLLFPNSDFENGDLSNWKPTGDAFIFQPTKGDNPTARNRHQPSNHQGAYWIGTYEQHQGFPDQNPGETQGDQPTGRLTSIPFRINEDHISFLVGGGKRLDSVYVALVVENKEVLKSSGNNHESMKRIIWDVSRHRGKIATILISDQFSGGWGHINADDFRYETGK